MTAAGTYTNEASATATTTGGAPLTHTSNRVLVEVPSAPIHVEVVVPTEAAQPTPAQTTPTVGPPAPIPMIQVLPQCVSSQPALRGLSGPKRSPFAVQIGSAGITQITFYLDGRNLKTMAQSQARGGKFTIKINPRKLSYGAHKLSVKAQRSQANCPVIARAGVFVHARAQRAAPKFTG